MIEEHAQQAIFGAAQSDHRAFRIEQMARGGIEPPVAEAQHLHRFRHLHAGRQHPGAAQHRADPREQLTRGKRLGQIVVGAHFQTEDPIGFLVAGGEHQHGHGAEFAGAQFTAQHETVRARQHQVEHDQIGCALFQRGAHLASVGRERHAHAVFLEVAGEQFADAAVVVDDQYMVGRFHRGTISYGG
ncbi:hypothetical protein LMG27177_02293 [Paraburkholderia fynbosensis]|uniref:Uncharacterized protein n=1 Tax=Paraburkholderia fynbosensis TaxID=1200993 RepID=A0A6J5FYV5_9BURK|nr:hypothetical protein LMG27177_02293 [Paraburkholderia fynbosensis]